MVLRHLAPQQLDSLVLYALLIDSEFSQQAIFGLSEQLHS